MEANKDTQMFKEDAPKTEKPLFKANLYVLFIALTIFAFGALYFFRFANDGKQDVSEVVQNANSDPEELIRLADQKQDKKAYFNLGLMFVNKNDPKHGIQAYNKIMTPDSSDLDLLNNLGVAYSGNAQFENAMLCFSRVLKLNPSYALAKNNLADVKQKYDQETKTSLNDVDSVIKLVQFSALSYNRQNYQLGIAQCEKALQLDPKCLDAYNNLGIIYYSMKEHKRSEFCFKKLLSLSPSYALAKNNLKLCQDAMSKNTTQ